MKFSRLELEFMVILQSYCWYRYLSGWLALAIERSLCLNLELNVYKCGSLPSFILLTCLFYPIQFEFQIKLEVPFEVIQDVFVHLCKSSLD